jgi:hypothetical protein
MGGWGGGGGGLSDIFVHEKRGGGFLCNINTCPTLPRPTIKPTDKKIESSRTVVNSNTTPFTKLITPA